MYFLSVINPGRGSSGFNQRLLSASASAFDW